MSNKAENEINLAEAFKWVVDVDGPAEALINAIVEELRVELPPRGECKALTQKDWTEFINAKLELLKLLDNVAVIAGGNATLHNREEIARWCSCSRETIRQCEENLYKKLHKYRSNDLKELKEELIAMEHPSWQSCVA